jgi:spore coat protein SA
VRIALIGSDRLPIPAIKGGAIQVLIDGIKGDLARGNQLTIYSVADPELPEREENNGIRYVRFPVQSFWNGVSAAIKENADKFDIIHIFNRPRYLLQIKEASPGSAVVLSLHNNMLGPGRINPSAGAEVVNASERILTVSSYIAGTVTRRYDSAASKVYVWYSGTDVKDLPDVWSQDGRRIREAFRHRLGLADKKILLFVGRVSRQKGVHVLLEAFLMLAKESSDLVLVIVGGKWHGSNRKNSYIRQLRKRSRPFKERVIFSGFVTPNEVQGYYLAGDVFVVPSQFQEPLARVHYEAMAAGIPIITSARGGNPEVIRDGSNGFVITDYQNPEAYASAVKMLLEQPAYAAALAKTARLDVVDKFSFQRVSGDLLNHYREVLHGQSPL